MLFKRLTAVAPVFPVLMAFLSSDSCFAQGVTTEGTTPFFIDGNRTFAELGFVRPDGSIHDRLLRVGDLETKGATWGSIYQAMHGNPGETRNLVLARNGKQLTVAAKVTGF